MVSVSLTHPPWLILGNLIKRCKEYEHLIRQPSNVRQRMFLMKGDPEAALQAFREEEGDEEPEPEPACRRYSGMMLFGIGKASMFRPFRISARSRSRSVDTIIMTSPCLRLEG